MTEEGFDIVNEKENSYEIDRESNVNAIAVKNFTCGVATIAIEGVSSSFSLHMFGMLILLVARQQIE